MITTDYESFATAVGDDFDLDDPAQAVTLAAYRVGPNIKRIATFLGRPRHWCAEPARRLREQGVWRSGQIVVDATDEETFGVEVALQCAIAAGFLEASR